MALLAVDPPDILQSECGASGMPAENHATARGSVADEGVAVVRP